MKMMEYSAAFANNFLSVNKILHQNVELFMYRTTKHELKRFKYNPTYYFMKCQEEACNKYATGLATIASCKLSYRMTFNLLRNYASKIVINPRPVFRMKK